MQSLNDTRATEAEGTLEQWSESSALRKELSRLREHYRKMHDHSALVRADELLEIGSLHISSYLSASLECEAKILVEVQSQANLK